MIRVRITVDSASSASAIRLVVNADDFGLSPAISRGILAAHRDGIVTSTSLLGNAADLEDARALLGGAPELGVGVHLTLVGGRPVSDPAAIPSLLAADGGFHARGGDLIAMWARGRVARTEVE